MIDLEAFERLEKLNIVKGIWKFYLIMNKSDGTKNIARSSYHYIRDFSRKMIIPFYREVNFTSRLNHPCILKFVGYNLMNFKDIPKPVIVTEYQSKFTLQKYIFNEDATHVSYDNIMDLPNDFFGSHLEDTQKLIIIYGIASCMSFIHSCNIIHCNLNPENIFLDDFYNPKISGFSDVIEIPQNQPEERPIKGSKIKGKRKYIAPEILNNLEYSKSSDVYSFSQIFRLLYFYNEYEIEKEDEEEDENHKKSNCYKDLIRRCSSKNPKLRPTFDQIVTELKTNHDFITDKIDEEKYKKYIKLIEETPKSFDKEIRKDKLYRIQKDNFHFFNQSTINRILRSNDLTKTDFDLTEFKPKFTKSNYLEYTLTEIERLNNNDENDEEEEEEENTESYYAEIYSKEINNFNKNEFVNFYRKLNIISQISHPAILKFIQYSPIDLNNNPKPVILYENFEESLDNEIKLYSKSEQSNWDDTRKLICIYGIASAMAYLHSHDIIHRDLKLENIFLDQMLLPKLSGFNISIFLNNQPKYKSNNIKGTPIYLAPEIYSKHEYSKSSDVYSFGLLIYEIITSKKAYENHYSPQQIKEFLLKEYQEPTYETPIYDIYRQLIKRCLSFEPSSRPTFEEIINELENNPEYITDEVDRYDFYKYMMILDKLPKKFDPTKRIKFYDDSYQTKLHTFNEIKAYAGLKNMYETETNDLSFDYNYFDLTGYEMIELKQGSAYDVKEIYNWDSYNEYCIKIFNINNFPKIVNISRELNIISKLNHPSILKFIGYSQNVNETDSSAIIVEYCYRGSLYNQIFDKNRTFVFCGRKGLKKVWSDFDEPEWDDTRKLINIYGIASAMAYLHSHDIIHRDLKLENIFLDQMLLPKLSGFNISIFLNNQPKHKSNNIKGTPIYLAPEIYSKHEYSKSSDVYSFGLLIYEIITSKKAYENHYSPQQIKEFLLKEYQEPTYETPIYEIYRQLIKRCLSFEPSSRPTFEEIINELENNPEYITDKINKKEYYEYIKSIKESQITFDNTKNITHLDYTIKAKRNQFKSKKEETKINFRSVYKTELIGISFDYDFINIKEYEKQKVIHISDIYKMYKIIHKDSNKIYFAKKFIDESGFYFDYFTNEINNYLSLSYHPSFFKFIGCSSIDFKNKEIPIYITEFGSNGSLEKVLDLDMENPTNLILDYTKRLIILYGIAAGMSYLHSQDIIHCCLKPSNIILDDFLFPKIIGLKRTVNISKNPIPDISKLRPKYAYYDNNIYNSPECVLYDKWCSASDVYSFAMIAYKLISNENQFPEINSKIIRNVCMKNLRPKFDESVPECYCKLIEKCWSNDPKERPTFDEILYHLKTNSDFINDSRINLDEFQGYVNMIDKYQSFQNSLQIEDFINSNNTVFRKVQVDFDKLRNPSITFSINIGSIDLNKFEKRKKIGSGSFGNVYHIYDKETENLYAAKISKYETDQCEDITIINLSREINIISKLDHLSILKYIGFSPTNLKNRHKPVIITELAINGSLDEVIEKERMSCGLHEWNDTKKLINIYGIASGMKYLHDQSILHRDLKPGNILLDENLYPKIADFGLSKFLTDQDYIEIKKKKPINSGFKGSLAYCAPEILRNNKYTKAGDVYAFGMIVYEIITNEILFDGYNQFQLLDQIIKGYRPEFKYPIPYCYRRLIEKCWNEDFERRLKFEEIVRILETDNDFISQNIDKDEYLNYISFIKEHQNHQNVHKVSFDILNEIKEEEIDIKSFDCFLDLSNFERHEIISKDDTSKLYKFRDKATGKICAGQMSMLKIKRISNEDVSKVSNEIKIIKEINHPCLLKFIGYSPIDFKKQYKPVIVTEYPVNRSLENILEIERNNNFISQWDDTKKLINIFGIAAAMSCLHSHDIIHRSLKPANIYLDEVLTPKIGDFGLLTRFPVSENITHQSISGIKATPVYSAPEILQWNKYSKSSDVYAFAFIIFELLTNEVPFNEIANKNLIFDEIVIKNNRPKFNKNISECYCKLIEKCWSQIPEDRPTFDDIVNELKVNSEFITKNIDKDSYYKYINFIENHINSENTQLNGKIKEDEVSSQENHSIEKINEDEINSNDIEINKIIKESEVNSQENNSNEEINEDKISCSKEIEVNEKMKESEVNSQEIHSNEEINEDKVNSKEIEVNEKMKESEVKSQENNSNEEINEDEINSKEIEVNEIINEDELDNIEYIEYLAKKYTLENDTENIYKYFCMLIKIGNCTIPLEYAVNLYKRKYYKQAFNYFTLISKSNHPIAKYFLGVMKYYGFGCDKDQNEAYAILKNLSDNGIDNATSFIEDHYENES